MRKLGRKPKAYITTWGETVPGLAIDADGRWRILATRQRYAEADEHTAVARFRQWEREHKPSTSVFLSVAKSYDPAAAVAVADRIDAPTRLMRIEHEDGAEEIGYEIDSKAMWQYVREQLLNNPVYVAAMTGIPQLKNLATFDLPKKAVTISEVIAAYREHSTATAIGKKRGLDSLNDLAAFANAKTLDELTDEILVAFRDQVVNNSDMKSSGTIGGYFSRLRGVLRIAARGNLDNQQVSRAIERCKAKLYSPESNVEDDPKPISREHFHKLLAGADQTNIAPTWKAMLYLALNAALYMEDICDLKWENLDLENKTFIGRRKKKGRRIRVAVLWNETIEALKALKRNGSPYVFVSATGTRYNKNTKINDFADMRAKAGVPDDVKWSHLRDGAYGEAFHAQGVDEKFAKLLAGHKQNGLPDKYVKREPWCVKPACDAVYAAYFG